jgi:hypothetical protein
MAGAKEIGAPFSIFSTTSHDKGRWLGIIMGVLPGEGETASTSLRCRQLVSHCVSSVFQLFDRRSWMRSSFELPLSPCGMSKVT